MEVGLGPGDIVLWWGHSSLTERDTAAPSPIFVLDGDPAPPPQKGAQPPPPKKKEIWPMSVVAKRLDGSRYHLVRR